MVKTRQEEGSDAGVEDAGVEDTEDSVCLLVGQSLLAVGQADWTIVLLFPACCSWWEPNPSAHVVIAGLPLPMCSVLLPAEK